MWATFEELKGKYWWLGLYRDVHRFVTTCESCQMHSIVRYRDELHPTYPPTVHFKWMVDAVFGAGPRGSDEPSGRPSPAEQDDVVVKKTVPKRNRCIKRGNRPFTCARPSMYIGEN